jgi:hypothetical protein
MQLDNISRLGAGRDAKQGVGFLVTVVPYQKAIRTSGDATLDGVIAFVDFDQNDCADDSAYQDANCGCYLVPGVIGWLWGRLAAFRGRGSAEQKRCKSNANVKEN